MQNTILTIFALSVLTACTSVTVKPVTSTVSMQRVCIQDNPKVQVSDFVKVIREGFDRHGISTEIFYGQKPAKCQYVLTYTALRSWDFSPYMTHAELRIEQDGRHIGSAEYHHKGGFALNKWAGTRSKMDPVIDELLANEGLANISSSEKTERLTSATDNPSLNKPISTSYIEELKALAALRDDGIITEAEFQKQKAEILAEN